MGKLGYFGTDLNRHGHYMFELSDGGMERNYRGCAGLPFDPEGLTNGLGKGEVVFYQGGGYTVVGFAGSCVDGRPNTKSIFWVSSTVGRDTMIGMVKSHPYAARIIEQCDFIIKW
jgi:hypothetical protein